MKSHRLQKIVDIGSRHYGVFFLVFLNPDPATISVLRLLLTPFIVALWGITLVVEIRLENKKRRLERARKINELLAAAEPEA